MTTNHRTIGWLARAALVLLAAGALSRMPGATQAIGTVVANGSFQIDHARVWGNATLFNGSVIETAAASSQVRLNQGVQLRLASSTRATVYENRLVLESGYSQIDSGANYQLEARSLHVAPAVRDAVALVHVANERKVVVAALQGSVRVTNAAGLLIANIEAGKSLDFEPQESGAAAPTQASGCLLSKNGAFILAEQTANLVLELTGPGLEQELGNRVEIAGEAEKSAPAVAGATQLIKVVQLKRISKGGCSAIAKKVGAAAGAGGAAAAAGAAAAGGAATAAGIGTGTTVAIIGGVAAAATVGGLGAAGSFSGSENPQPASR